MQDFELECEFNRKYSIITRKILRMLSENCRMTLTEMSKNLKLSRRNVSKRLARIEQEFGIKYTLDISKRKLGLINPHIILIKFGNKPDIEEVVAQFNKTYVAQIVVPVKGTYDMLVYANSASFKDYIDWDRDTRRAFLLKYKMRWEQSVVIFTRIGFYPLRNELILHSRLSGEEKSMMVILNEDSRISLKDMARRLHINYKTCVYRFNELVNKKYIKRFTISMDIPKGVSMMSLFAKYVPTEGVKLAKDYTRKMFTTDEHEPLVGRYALKLSLIGSYDSFAVGAFDDKRMGKRNMVDMYRKLFGGFSPLKLEYGEISSPLIGRLPVRSMDIKAEYYSR